MTRWPPRICHALTRACPRVPQAFHDALRYYPRGKEEYGDYEAMFDGMTHGPEDERRQLDTPVRLRAGILPDEGWRDAQLQIRRGHVTGM